MSITSLEIASLRSGMAYYGHDTLQIVSDTLLASFDGKASRIALVVDQTLADDISISVARDFVRNGFRVCDYTVVPSSTSLSISHLAALQSAFANDKISASDCVIAIGDTSILHLAACASHTYAGGLPIVLIPSGARSALVGMYAPYFLNDEMDRPVYQIQTQPYSIYIDDNLIFTNDDVMTRQCGASICQLALMGVLPSDIDVYELIHADPQVMYQSIPLLSLDSYVHATNSSSLSITSPLHPCSMGNHFVHALQLMTDNALQELPYDEYIRDGGALADGLRFALFVSLQHDICDLDYVQLWSNILNELGLPKSCSLMNADAMSDAMAASYLRQNHGLFLQIPQQIGIQTSHRVTRNSLLGYLESFFASEI